MMEKNKIVIALTGGGTAGHILPTIEVGKTLKKEKSDLEIIYLGNKGGLEEELSRKNGFKFFAISSAKWHRYLSFSNLLTPFKIWKGIKQAKKILKENILLLVKSICAYEAVPSRQSI